MSPEATVALVAGVLLGVVLAVSADRLRGRRAHQVERSTPSPGPYDDDRTRLDRAAVHAYLGGISYWAKGRTREQQDELIDGSGHVVGLYKDGTQIGFARAVDCGAAGFVYLLPKVRGSRRRSHPAGALLDQIQANLRGIGGAKEPRIVQA